MEIDFVVFKFVERVHSFEFILLDIEERRNMYFEILYRPVNSVCWQFKQNLAYVALTLLWELQYKTPKIQFWGVRNLSFAADLGSL